MPIKHPFEVIDGGKNSSLEKRFGSAASSAVGLPNARKLSAFTNNVIMHDMFDAFQTAYEQGAEGLDIHLNRFLGGFDYVMTPIDVNDPDYEPTSHPVFSFHFKAPFHDQFPASLIRSVKSIDDILEAFEEIEFERGDITDEAEIDPRNTDQTLAQIIPPIFSEKIEAVKALFEKEREKEESDFLYVRLMQNGEITPLEIMTDPPNVRDLNNLIQKISPDDYIVMGLNFYEDFEDQIQSGDFDPYTLKSWESLKSNPLDCITPIVEIQKRLEAAPTTLGPNRPVIAWDNTP